MALVLPLLEKLGKDKHEKAYDFLVWTRVRFPPTPRIKKALIISELSFFLFSFLSSENASSGLTRRIM